MRARGLPGELRRVDGIGQGQHPAEARTLMTSAPYFTCRRTALTQSSGLSHTPS